MPLQRAVQFSRDLSFEARHAELLADPAGLCEVLRAGAAAASAKADATLKRVHDVLGFIPE